MGSCSKAFSSCFLVPLDDDDEDDDDVDAADDVDLDLPPPFFIDDERATIFFCTGIVLPGCLMAPAWGLGGNLMVGGCLAIDLVGRFWRE